MKSMLVTLLLVLVCILELPAASPPLLDQEARENARRHQYALDHGARFLPTPDGKSFYVWWEPPGKSDAPVLVTLHGHGRWATDEFFLWRSMAEQRGFAIMAIQWWFGDGEGPGHYYQPHQLYPIMESVLRRRGTPPGGAILHGFSVGSANSYAIVALDRDTGNDFLGLCIANAGCAEVDLPPTRAVAEGRFGSSPYVGTHWVLYAGCQDTQNPEKSGPAAMAATKAWIEKMGGAVDLFLQDPTGDHGGFHRNPENMKRALDCYPWPPGP